MLPSDSSALEKPISATWSTKINQFFPLNCEITPLPLLRRKESTETNLPSPRVCLHDILEGNEDEDSEDLFDNLAPLFAVDEQVDDTEHPPPITDMMMEEEEYKTRLAAAHKAVVKVRLRIDEFTADAVNIGDKDTYKADLDEIRNEFRLAREKIYDLIIDLDPDQDERRIKQRKDMDTQVTEKFKTNDKAVIKWSVSLLLLKRPPLKLLRQRKKRQQRRR